MLGEQIVLHPCADGVERYLTAEVSGNHAGLLRLALGKNKDAGRAPPTGFILPDGTGATAPYSVGCGGPILAVFQTPVRIALK